MDYESRWYWGGLEVVKEDFSRDLGIETLPKVAEEVMEFARTADNLIKVAVYQNMRGVEYESLIECLKSSSPSIPILKGRL